MSDSVAHEYTYVVAWKRSEYGRHLALFRGGVRSLGHY